MASSLLVCSVLILIVFSQVSDQNQDKGASGEGDSSPADGSEEFVSAEEYQDNNGSSDESPEKQSSSASSSSEEDKGDEGRKQKTNSHQQPTNNQQQIQQDACEIKCYCNKESQPKCVREYKKAPQAAQPAPPKPNQQSSPKPKRHHRPGAGTAVAAGAAVAGAAALNNQHKRNKPKEAHKPQKPESKKSEPAPDNTMPKCNWCIRKGCNPGACRAAKNFNPKEDAMRIHKGTEGLGTDENTLFEILTHRSDEQLEMIRRAYQVTGSGLDKDIAKDTSFKTKKLLLALLTPRAEFFADELKKAFGEKDVSAMVMILTSLSPCAIQEVGSAYLRKYGESLADDIKRASMLNFEKFLVELSKGDRDMSDNVDVKVAEADADALIAAGVDSWWTDQKTFIDIFSKRSYAHLHKMIEIYDGKRKGKSDGILEDIEKVTTDKLKKGLLTLVKNVLNQPYYFADELEGAIDSILPTVGDNDKLVRIMRGRCGIDLGDIRDIFPLNHDNKQLAKRIAEKTWWDYTDALVSMLSQKD